MLKTRAERSRSKKASLQEVATFLDVPYSTVSKWSKKKKEALRYGVVVIKEIQKG